MGRLRRRPRRTEPLSVKPSTPFEIAILERLTAMQADIADLQDSQKWLLRLVAGAVLAAILNLVLR